MCNLINTILFDADGVLFDATELHKDALNLALKEYMIPQISDEDHIKIFNGLPTKVKLNILTDTIKLPVSLHNPIEEVKQKYTIQLIKQTIFPNIGLIKCLQKLKDRNFRLVVCSNAILNSVEEMARCSNVYEFFETILGNEAVLKNKPAPDIYLLAMKILKVKPVQCAIVEDSPKGIVSAIGAGPGLLIKVKNPDDTVTQLKRYFDL